ncbi:EAL domain-containing protein [Aureimonas sp. AU20]|uniref:bifunctional diguanylate cyclase/phosphodiesterase n=1 Tax=Aureimonas sp. AU20 TaxID=1349819 RepID=UPI0007227227|nr:EAL domain-containing protein [Aureimonas sp. AU20]ALN75327.1 hypothetical protein M673_21565 [Aureimonas sp. AU20]
MVEIFLTLAKDHAITLVVAATVVCIVASWLFFDLFERVRGTVGLSRLQWLGFAALAGGLGVWTTHFIATLGYRPDFAFSFDPDMTAASALISVAIVGLPAALTALTDRTWLKLLGGAVTGAGIVLMHVAGMAALTNCGVEQPAAGAVPIALASAALCALAMALPERTRPGIRIALAVAAVSLVHFGLIAGTAIVPVGSEPSGIDRSILGFLVGIVVICLALSAGALVTSSSKLAEQKQREALFSNALTNMSNGLLVIGAGGRIDLFNDRLVTLFDIRPEGVAIGMPWQRYLANLAERLGWNEARLGRVIDNHTQWFALDRTTYLEHALEDGRTISVSCRPIMGGGAVLTYDDVTAERQAQREVERLAFHDPLTGLPNRRKFAQELEAAYEGRRAATLFLIDLDRFKIVNDTLGHAAGDWLLTECGVRMGRVCERGELVARLAGDEFAVLSLSCDEDEAAGLSRRIIATLSDPFLIHGRMVSVGCSIGMASTRDAASADVMIQHADLALYKAKTLGRGRNQRYEAGMQEAAMRRSVLEADLRGALERGEFTLLYQPLYRIEDRSVLGFEALIRWQHPARGFISPGEFIPVAEETGLIREIGLWIVEEACRHVRQWPDGIHVAVNVSPVQLRSEGFPGEVARLLEAAGVSPDRLEIELTETALVEDSELIAASLRTLRDSGIRVAMDDFGTGYSSLAHLRKFDLDCIKIDLSFVQTAPFDPAAAAVLHAVVQLARGLGVGTVGEGVETEEQFEVLRQAGCEVAQGYLLGRPMTAMQAYALCRAETRQNVRRALARRSVAV